MKENPHTLLILILSFILVGCNLGAPVPQDGTDLATSAAQTVEAVLTKPAATSTEQKVAASTPSPIPGVAIDGTTAEPVACVENTKIVRWERNGVTYDKTEVEKRLDPNEGFVMSWVIQNTGTCTWTDGYNMVFDSGERITPTDSFNPIPLGQTVPPGGEMSFSVPMAAPSKSGNHETTFRFDNAKGERVMFIGVLTYVGTPSTGNLPAPGDLRYTYDCSGGITRISLTWKDKADSEEGYRIYRDGQKITDLPAGSTVYDDIAPSPGSYRYTVAAFNASGESPANVQAETTNCQ